MKLEEIVALSVKHNVSDLHLCNSAAPRWRRQGRLEPAPFPAPDIANLLNDWLDAAQLLHWQEHGQIDFALNSPAVRGCAPAPSPIRVGYRWCCVSFLNSARVWICSAPRLR